MISVALASAAPAPPPSAACPAESAAYVPRPATSVEARLPEVPTLEGKPVKIADAYTVWGASYYRKSRAHRKEVSGKTIEIEGYIVKTNLPNAPRCAVHRTGIADREDCRAPVPAFFIGDSRDAPLSACIKVMGWASNYAQIFGAIRAFDANRPDYIDELWGVSLPNPLPAAGAKVRVSGRYGASFAMASSGSEMNTDMGLLTYERMTTTEAAPEPATLPGVKRVRKMP